MPQVSETMLPRWQRDVTDMKPIYLWLKLALQSDKFAHHSGPHHKRFQLIGGLAPAV